MEKTRTLVGIDGSSNRTGYAIIRDGKLKKYGLIDLRKYSDSDERISLMTMLIADVLEEYQPDSVWMEDTWVANNPKTSKMLTTILGGVRYWCVCHGSEFNTLLPSVWRKSLNINDSKAKREELKQKSMDYVKDHFNIDVSDDISDAICIALVGYMRGSENDYCR